MSYVQRNGLLVPAQFAAPGKPDLREIATTRDGRDITRGYVDPMQLQQPTDSVLRLRGGGDYLIYQEVLRDDQVAACFNQRRLAVIGKEWGVDAGDNRRDSKKAADQLRESLEHIGWDRVTDRMLFGVFYGYAVGEPLWAVDGQHITIDALKVRDRRRFGWDGAQRLRLKTSSDPQGELLPDRKFWTFATGADHDDEPYGLGLAHWLYWPVFFKRAGLEYWLVFLERFGQPTAIGEHPGGATPEERQKLLNALEAIATDTGIAIPAGMKIELLEASRSGTADYSALCAHMDAAIAKVTLGQVASTQGTPGKLGNDDLQGDVRLDLIKADADLVCESFNRSVVRWLTDWNYPNAAPPRVYRKVEPDEDLAQRAERDTKIISLGYAPTLDYVRDTYGEGWEPQAPAEPAQPVAPELQPGQAPAQFAAAGAALSADADQLDDDLAPFLDQWIDRIRALVDTADSLDAVRDGLVALIPDMNLEQYAEAMAQALAAAALRGRHDVLNEVGRGR